MLRLQSLAGVLLLASLAVIAWLPRPAAVPSVLREQPVALTAPVTAEPTTIEELRAAVLDVLRREKVPGVGLAIVDADGVVWAGGVGVANVDSGDPVTDETVFRVASITKSVVALGVMKLADAGRLSLDQPLRESLPELSLENPFADVAPITLAHALEHTAGFDDMHFNEYFNDDEGLSPSDALAINPRSRAVRWRPGSRMAYSNVGYSVAALAIERAAGQPFDRYLRRQVLEPLGMRRARWRRTESVRPRLATGYLRPGAEAPFRALSHRGAGALLASPRELAALVHLFIARGRGYESIVSPEALARIERSATGDIAPTDDNYGLGNAGDVAHAVVSRGHDGGLPGFLSAYRYFPELSTGYVMLLNATHSRRAYQQIRQLLFRYVARGKRFPPPPVVAPAPDRDQEAAFYAFASPRHSLLGFIGRALVGWDVSVTTDGLMISGLGGGGRGALVPTRDGAYRVVGEGGSSVRFGDDAQGERVMVAGWAYAERGSRTVAVWRRRAIGGAVLLLQLAPLWALAWWVVRLLGRRSTSEMALVMWPAVAGLCTSAFLMLFSVAADRGVIGELGTTTVAIFAVTLLFAVAAGAGLVAAIRLATAPKRPSWLVRIVPSLTSVAAFGMTLWLGFHGVIGLRTWAW